MAWPGWRTTAWHVDAKEPDIRTWWGGLVDGMRDVSGQMYMRNRYYDPATGQFTQQDPIGIAGGLNTYGFAAGDPVTYSDPYGLSAEECCTGAYDGISVRRLEADARNFERHSPRDRLSTLEAASVVIPGAGLLGRVGGSLLRRAGIRTGATAARTATTSGNLRILEREGNHIIGAFNGANGEARFVTEMVRHGDDLVLRGTHIEGSATLRESLSVARSFGREQGAKRVVIQGGIRTTGARPGHAPRQITLETGL